MASEDAIRLDTNPHITAGPGNTGEKLVSKQTKESKELFLKLLVFSKELQATGPHM